MQRCMPHSGMTCREAIEDVFRSDPGVLSTQDVISRIYAKYPNEPWQRNTISTSLIALSRSSKW